MVAPARGSNSSLVRPEFGPTLPALLQQRRGVPQRVTLAALALLLVGVAIVLYLRRDDPAELAHRTKPPFTMLYSPGILDRVDPRPGEVFRLQARGRGVAVSVTAQLFRLPPYHGFGSAVLPLYAEHHIATLRGRFASFELRTEGKTRIHNALGYQVGFQARASRRQVYGRDVLLVPDRPGPRDGVLVSLVQTTTGASLNSGDRRAIEFARKAVGSLRFGS